MSKACVNLAASCVYTSLRLDPPYVLASHAPCTSPARCNLSDRASKLALCKQRQPLTIIALLGNVKQCFNPLPTRARVGIRTTRGSLIELSPRVVHGQWPACCVDTGTQSVDN